MKNKKQTVFVKNPFYLIRELNWYFGDSDDVYS